MPPDFHVTDNILDNEPTMRTLPFLLITLVSGAISGTILGIINLSVVEPYIDKAIELETQNDIKAGQNVNMDEIAGYRMWQKSGEIFGGIIYGISLSSLFGIVFAYSRSSLPGNNATMKAMFLASIMCFVLFIVPGLKYPSNPPAVGDPDTIYYRQGLFVAFLVISGVSALGVTVVIKKIDQTVSKKVAISCTIYGAIMIVSYLVMPSNPDKISISMSLIEIFRLASATTIVMFWGILGAIFGTLWNRFEPHNFEKITAF
jgi:predicted cobalt transporter CbtA